MALIRTTAQDASRQGRRGTSTQPGAGTPPAVFVLVPSQADSGQAAGDGDRQYRMRKLDQVASNDMRCSRIQGSLPDECITQGGTGAAATASTQGQSGR